LLSAYTGEVSLPNRRSGSRAKSRPEVVAKLAHTVGDRVNLELKTRGVRAVDGLSGENHGALPEKSEAKK
jgi:hypothetical protein